MPFTKTVYPARLAPFQIVTVPIVGAGQAGGSFAIHQHPVPACLPLAQGLKFGEDA